MFVLDGEFALWTNENIRRDGGPRACEMWGDGTGGCFCRGLGAIIVPGVDIDCEELGVEIAMLSMAFLTKEIFLDYVILK